MKKEKKSNCIYCNGPTMVLETRHSAIVVRRRRKCLRCNKRTTTLEVPILSDYFKIKIENIIKDIRTII